MRSTRRRFLAAVACLGSGFAPAQQPADAGVGAADRTVDAALEAWHGAREQAEPKRRAALARLGALDDPRVTAALFDELELAGTKPAAIAVLDAIGARPRGTRIRPLRTALLADGADDAFRRAAAIATGKQGRAGVELLLDLARNPDVASDAVRDACLDGLAAANDERAWRGLAPFALTGGDLQKLKVLRLLEPVRGIAVVTQVRTRLLKESHAEIALTAWHQLALDGWADAAAAFEDLDERWSGQLQPPAVAHAVGGLALVLTPGLHERFLVLAANEAAVVQDALRREVPRLARNEPFVRWLCGKGLAGRGAPERQVAFAVLRKADLSLVQPLLAKVRAELRTLTPEVLSLAIGLHELLNRDPSWQDDVLKLAHSPEPALRTAGLALLLEMGIGSAVALAQQGLESKTWELRAVAYRYLGRFRELSSIPLLIACTAREDGRLADELNDTLFMHTGTRCWLHTDWEQWWRKHAGTHALPPAESVRRGTQKTGGGGTAYYGIPVTSHRFAFLVDVSGSMRAPIGTDKKRTRLDEARRQLLGVVDGLGETHRFNVISFESGVASAWDALREAKDANKQQLRALLQRLQPQGGTNIHDALELAFRDPGIDTIYLLSDGTPTAGRIVNADELADQVRRWNYSRQVVVHCVAVGDDAPLLRRLANESGGQYVYVR